ncbi:DUF3556 domain-containing protein [Mycolicibacterium confluentis]|nr:DUF3556 domain-containing protein [Mycolicibacterium confluentis]
MIESGTFRVADVVDRQPWELDVPITVDDGRSRP